MSTLCGSGIRAVPRFALRPAEARSVLRFELERMVAEADVRHRVVAGWLGVSRPAASAALACTSLLSRPALEVLCARLGRGELLPRLESLVTAARGKGREPGPPGLPAPPGPRDAELVIGLEAFADGVTVFDPWLVPPHLRAPRYSAALGGADSEERRRVSVLDGLDGLDFRWITSEHALRGHFGDPAVMGEQLAHLAALGARSNVVVEVVPEPVSVGPFTLIRGTPPVVVEPGRIAMRVCSSPDVVADFTRVCDELRGRASG